MYKSLGKFVRAVDRTLLVTSAYSDFTSDTYAAGGDSRGPLSPHGYPDTLRASTTPLFSPIPFLHPDMDPVTGLAIAAGSGSPLSRRHIPDAPSPLMLDEDIPPPSPRLGLVDELDDPSADSNHLADHPQAITSKMRSASRVVDDEDDMDLDEADLFGPTVGEYKHGARGGASGANGSNGSSSSNSRGLGFGGSVQVPPLNDRFVRSTTPEPETARAMREAGDVLRPAGGINRQGGSDEEEVKDAAEDGEVEDMILDHPEDEEESQAKSPTTSTARPRQRKVLLRDRTQGSK